MPLAIGKIADDVYIFSSFQIIQRILDEKGSIFGLTVFKATS